MSKRELIDAIIKHNQTAAPEFLALFPESDLKAYLDRVCTLHIEQQIRTNATGKKRDLVMA